MKHLAEYRDPESVRRLAREIRQAATRPWTIMEVCGGQTRSIVQNGLEDLLPEELRLIHGPGCPVCVTPAELIDHAVGIALDPRATLCSFGDMLRVPGTGMSLNDAKAAGGDVRVLYSPVDALAIARRDPQREVVFFAVGFETTAPAYAMAVKQAAAEGLRNFSLLVSLVRVPPAIELILSSPGARVDGFLAAGHVCTVMGTAEYEPIASRYRVPIVVTGFEPVDILQGVLMAVRQLEQGRAEVEIQYARCVRPGGNATARQAIEEVFHTVDRAWRGIGEIPRSGLALRAGYALFDAAARFAPSQEAGGPAAEAGSCIAGLVLQGIKKPTECPWFGGECTPDSPRGAPMVSSEGACASYYAYGRRERP